MYAQYYRLMKLHVLLAELLPRTAVVNPYTALIEKAGSNYDPKLKRLFYSLVEGLARMHRVNYGDKRERGYVQVSRQDMILSLSLMKDLLKPPKEKHLGAGAIRTYCFLTDYPQGLSIKELTLKSHVPLNTLKHHVLDLHAHGYITREQRRGRSGQKYYVYKAVTEA
jgi:hypothetical protein